MPQQAPADPATQPEPLWTALLLACTGGLLDAATWLLHGHVFAAAQTGNIVLLGVSAFSGNAIEILRHITPIVGYVAGVLTSKHIRVRMGRTAAILGLLLEAALLAAAGLLPASFPQMAFTPCIAFVAALQVADLRHVGPFSYNSTFVTGDLRDTVEGFYDWLAPSSNHQTLAKARLQARDLGLICLCFLAGAATGALAAPRLGNHAYWIALPALLAAIPGTLARHTPPANPASNPKA